jgi:hypothetical protein
MSSRSRRQMPNRVASAVEPDRAQPLKADAIPASREAITFNESHTSHEGPAESVSSRRLSNGQVGIGVAVIGAAATIATAALNGMFGLASSHSASIPTLSSVTSATPSSSSAPASVFLKSTASSGRTAAGPLVGGDDSAFIKDVTYPDGSKVIIGQHFIKKWEIENTGTVPWINRYLVPDGESTGACSYPSRVRVPTTNPGHATVISVPVTAPDSPQVCYVTWKMANGTGSLYFPNEIGIWFNVSIIANPRQ